MLTNLLLVSGCALLGLSNAMTVSERKIILDAHNKYRSQLAKGTLDSRFPAASDMNMLFYDPALEEVGQAWINRCQWQHNPDATGDFAATEGRSFNYQGGWVGENLYGRSPIPSAGTDRNAILENAVKSWVDEYKDWSYPDSCNSGAVCGHFTQNAFAATRYVGCAFADCSSKGWIYLVCNYFPGRYGSLWTQGSGASACPADRTANLTSGLCEGCQDPDATHCSTCSNAPQTCSNGAGTQIGTITPAPVPATPSPTGISMAPTGVTPSPTSDTTGPTKAPILPGQTPKPTNMVTTSQPTPDTASPTGVTGAPTGNTPSPVMPTPMPTGATPSPVALEMPPSMTTTNAMIPTITPRQTFRYQDKKAILAKINGFRSDIALGNVANYAAASNMHSLTWDQDLEDVAQQWVGSCPSQLTLSDASDHLLALKEAGMAASSTGDADNFNVARPYNRVMYSIAADTLDPVTRDNIFALTEGMLDSFFDEKDLCSNGVTSFDCINFKNLIHAETRFVGCSFAICPYNGANKLLLSCMYWPTFHVKTENSYIEGSQDDCPQDKTRSSITGLCEGCNAPNAGMCVNYYSDSYCDGGASFCSYCDNSAYDAWCLCTSCRASCSMCTAADYVAPASCTDGIADMDTSSTPAPIAIGGLANTNSSAFSGQSGTVIAILIIVTALCSAYAAFATYHAFFKEKPVRSVGGTPLHVHDSMHVADKPSNNTGTSNADYL